LHWRKVYLEGSLVGLGPNKTAVRASKFRDAHRRINQLEAALGHEMLENQIFKETLDVTTAKKWMAHSPALHGIAPVMANDPTRSSYVSMLLQITSRYQQIDKHKLEL
jgi:hypothetical protein